MCGIVYMQNFDTKKSVSNRVLKQFKRQIRRGTTSFGFALPDKHVNNWKIKYEDIARSLRRTVNPEVLFHHRLSTSTADRITACHPFSTKDWFEHEFVGVHNGMLSNEHLLYERHKERLPGLRYVSDNGKDFNDSEAYIYDLASYFSGVTDAVEMTGYGAFIVVEYDKETHERLKLHFGTTSTGSAPLRVHHTENHLDVTSEGKGWLVKADTHYIYDYATKELTDRPLARKPQYSQYDPYDNYYGRGYDGFGSSYSSSSVCSQGSTMSEKMREPNLTSWEQDLMDEDDELIIQQLNEAYPEREHYGWSMYPNGCCEACDDQGLLLEGAVHYPDHDLTSKSEMREAIESLIVQQRLDEKAVSA